jgi:hypothetical protein
MTNEALTPERIMQLHRTRARLGQEMVRLLANRSVDEEHDTVFAREADAIQDMRAEVWNAESRAIRADPLEKYLPPELKRETGDDI